MRWGKIAFLGLVIAVALSAYAVGAGSGSSKTVVLCAAKKGGDLTLADGGKCAKGEKKISIAKQGPTGAQGAVGPQGVAGLPGGSAPPEAPRLVTAKTTACAVQTGSFCVTESGLCWNMVNAGGGLAPVAFWKDADGVVHLEGAFNNSNSSGACGGEIPPVFYLPTGFKPVGGSQRFMVPSCTGFEHFGYISVATDGRVSAGSPNDVCLSLSGIVFRAGA